MNQAWIQDEILRGLQKLLSLSLDRTPASELLPITVGSWVETITQNRLFDEPLDARRFRQAFVTLAGTRRTWPSPADFLAALPERDQLALTKTTIKADPVRAAKAVNEIAQLLRSGNHGAGHG